MVYSTSIRSLNYFLPVFCTLNSKASEVCPVTCNACIIQSNAPTSLIVKQPTESPTKRPSKQPSSVQLNTDPPTKQPVTQPSPSPPTPCSENDQGRFFYAMVNGKQRIKSCTWLQGKGDNIRNTICTYGISNGSFDSGKL